MKVILTLCIMGLGLAVKDTSKFYIKFKEWIIKNNKTYDTDLEYRYRFAIFAENLANIEEIKYNKYNYILSINNFADLNFEEINAKI